MMEQNQIVKKKEKNNKKLIFIIIILLIVVLGLSAYIIVDKMELLQNENTNKTTTPPIEEKEQIITNAALKEELSKKINVINGVRYTEQEGDYIDINAYIFDDTALINGTLTNDEKLRLTLGSLYNEYTDIKVPIDKINIEESILQGYKEYGTSGDHQVTMDKVKRQYENVFGSEGYSVKNIGKCPSYYADEENSVYYVLSRCGGTSAGWVMIYKNKYVKKGNEVYVYVNYGSIYGSINENDGKIYNNFQISEDKAPIEEFENIKDFEINDSNKDKFSEYKYTFKLNDDNQYNFVKVEKVN